MYKWRDNYITGIKVIDDQHKELFKILEKLNKSENTNDDLYDIFEALLEYTVYHFNSEEDLLSGYDLKDHRNEHNRLIALLNEQDLSVLDNETPQFRLELVSLVSNWIRTHVIEEIEQFRKLNIATQLITS